MPHVLKGQDLPESKLKCDQTLNKIMLCLNIALPFLNYVAVFYVNSISATKWVLILCVCMKFLILLLQLVTGIFLGYAINEIIKKLKSGDNPAEVDVRILAVHAIAFGLYMISIIVSFILLAYYVII